MTAGMGNPKTPRQKPHRDARHRQPGQAEETVGPAQFSEGSGVGRRRISGSLIWDQ
jgi:hypothetical protein